MLRGTLTISEQAEEGMRELKGVPAAGGKPEESSAERIVCLQKEGEDNGLGGCQSSGPA